MVNKSLNYKESQKEGGKVRESIDMEKRIMWVIKLVGAVVTVIAAFIIFIATLKLARAQDLRPEQEKSAVAPKEEPGVVSSASEQAEEIKEATEEEKDEAHRKRLITEFNALKQKIDRLDNQRAACKERQIEIRGVIKFLGQKEKKEQDG